jgi:hypothetical protein
MADFFFHTMAGWFMVPIALGLMLLEWKILNTLFYEPEETVVSMRLGPSRARAAVGK